MPKFKKPKNRGLDKAGKRVACIKCGIKIHYGKVPKKGYWNRTGKSYIGRCPRCGGYNTFGAPPAGDRRHDKRVKAKPKRKHATRRRTKSAREAAVTKLADLPP